MGMFGFLKKKQPEQVPSPPQMPNAPLKEPDFDMPDIKFDFQQAGMDAPPLPQGPSQTQGMPPMPQQSAPPKEQVTWRFDTKQQTDKYPLPPDSPPMMAPSRQDDMPPIKPLKFDEISMPKRALYDDQPEPQLEEPLEKPEDDEEGTEPPGIMPDEMPEKQQPELKKVETEQNFDFDESEFNFEDEAPLKVTPPLRPVAIERPSMPPPKPIARRVIDHDLFINVEDFRQIANLVGSLGDETRMGEEGLLRVKDITLGKEKVYDKWQVDLEQIEKELIQLDKVLFKM
jgi:hypothetical protein